MTADVYVKQIGDGELPPGAIPAVSEPSLIIRIDDTYWVPLAMVGYRLADAIEPAEVTGCNNIIGSFNALAVANGILVAVLDDSPDLVPSDQSTNPRGSTG